MIKAIKITILSLLCICLVGFMVTFITSGFKFSNVKYKLVLDEKYELNNKKKISINVKSSDINIYESRDDKIKVEIYSDDKKNVKVEETDEGLLIEDKKSKSCIGFCFSFNSGKKINLYIPKEYEGKFNINATSGDIKSELLTYNDYTINVTSGDIELDNINSLSGKATSGDVEIEKINSYIDFKTTSGDIEIDDLTLTRDSSIKVTSGDVTIDKCTNAYINTSVKSGDIDVNKNDRHAEYELKITTTSGDIEVN